MNVSGKAFTNKDKLIVKLVLTADGSTIGFGPEVDVSITNTLGTTGINEKLRPAAKPGEVPRRPKPIVGSVGTPDRRQQHKDDPRPKKPL